jgi:hypothetical protein
LTEEDSVRNCFLQNKQFRMIHPAGTGSDRMQMQAIRIKSLFSKVSRNEYSEAKRWEGKSINHEVTPPPTPQSAGDRCPPNCWGHESGDSRHTKEV